ncbi:MAG TPA: hypothetical protein VFC12_09315 [Terriglobales bacterium]|nr:hypothetical protein [Terriglobales bacterium]
MTKRWSDEEIDLGLRDLFSQARQPATPPMLRMYPRSVVARPRRRAFGGFALHSRVHGFVTVTATLAIALAVVSAVLIVKPGSQVGSEVSPSSSRSASASVSNALPDRVASGGFVWTRLSLPTEPSSFGWTFFKVGGISFGADCFASVPGQMWTSTDDLKWTKGGILPGEASGDRVCVSDVVWDGSRYVVSGGIAHPSASNVLLPAVWTSPDAQHWIGVRLPSNFPSEGMESLAFGQGGYVTGGADGLWRSTDLTHWTKVQVVPSASADAPAPVVRFDGSAFVAAATAAATGQTGTSFAYSSRDGITWTRADLGGPILTLVARATGFVAVVRQSDNSVVAKDSADGHTWSPLGVLPIIPSSCNWGMLVCGQPGSISESWVYSSDGVSWQDVPWPAGLPSGNLGWGPSPDPIFINVMNGSGASADSAVYVIQRQP